MRLFTSLGGDGPKLNNTWGDFNKIINYVLDGGTQYQVASIMSIAENKVKITFPTAVKFVRYQVVEISGSTNALYNTTFFIESISLDNLSITCYKKDLIILQEDVTASLRCRVAPCGMTKVFGGLSDQRTVFKTASGMHFRIDDRNFAPLVTPATTFNNSWMKMARVCMSSSFDSLDSSLDRLYPYYDLRPNENFKPDGKYIGQNIFIYNVTDYNSSDYITYQYGTRGALDWNIYADENIMYIYTFTLNSSTTIIRSRCYIMGDYEPLDSNAYKGILLSYTTNNTYDVNNMYYIFDESTSYTNSTSNNSLIFPCNNQSYTNGTMVIYDNSLGAASGVNYSSEFSIGNTHGSGYGGLSYPNRLDNSIYISDILVYSGGTLYGKMKGVKWVNTSVVSNNQNSSGNIKMNELVNIGGKYYIGGRAGSYSYYNNSVGLFEVER